MEWISVNDRLPEDMKEIMFWGRCKDYHKDTPNSAFIGVLKDSDNTMTWHSLGYEVLNVTHWMPLPEPPKTTPEE